MYILCKGWIIVILICSFIWRANTYKAEQIIRRGPGQDPQCADPLINSVDKFPDTSFSSSSVWKNATDFQPFRARLTEVYGSNEHTSGYAWCPNTHVEDGLREWIQAEFSHLVIISVIFTAGRGDGNVKEYMPNFVLRYQREDNGVWYEHVKTDGTRVLKANNDPRNIARTTLDSVVIAKRIRIYPYSHRSKQQVCLRFALYGCDFPDGVISYSMPQGDTITYGQQLLFGSPYSTIPQNFQDLTYDGQLIELENQLVGGIGQLMDNIAYLGNVTQHSDSHPAQPGFHFIGWNVPNKNLRIVFKFDEVRTFIWLRIFTFDSVPLKSRVFSQAIVEFSMDGKNFDKSIEISTNHARLIDPSQINPTRLSISDNDIQSSSSLSRLKRTSNSMHNGLIQDTIIYNNHEWDGALVVQIPLASYRARYVSLTLTSTDSWILLSEVQFNSTIVQPKSLLPLLSNEEINNNNNKSMKKPPDDDTSNHLDNSQKKLFNTDENSFRASSRIGDHSEMLNKQDIRNSNKPMNPEIHSPMSVGNEKSLTSNHEIRSAEENLGNHNENYYSASSSSTSISSSSSSSSSSSLSASSSQLSQIIVIVSYVLGAILCLFILLAIIIIIQRKCKHYLHFKHQCCKQLTVETTGISPNQSGGFYSPLSLIGTCGSTNHHPHGVNSLLNYNVVNTMNIPEAAKLLQSLSTLSPNTRTTLTTTTTDNFVHNNNNNCLSNNGGNVGGVGVNHTVLHHPNNILQYTMNNNSNTLATESNSIIVNNNNNRLFGTTCANSIGGIGDGRISKLDYASTIGQPLPPPPPPTLPNGLLLPCIPQTGVVGGIGMNHHNHPGKTDQHHHQIIEQPTSIYMQTNAANRLVGNDLNSLNGMSPEYASASIFGFTPPPSDLSDGASIHCGENNNNGNNNIPSNYYRPIISRLGNNQHYPTSGLMPNLNSNYNGPVSTLSNTGGPTYELHTKIHILPNDTINNNNSNNNINNNEQFYSSTVNQPNATGFLFLPRSQIGNVGGGGGGTMMNRISFATNQFPQLSHTNIPSNNGFISVTSGDLYNIYQTTGINLPIQSNLQTSLQQQQQQMYCQQQPTEYKFIKQSDDNTTWQLSSTLSNNRQSIIINSTPQQISPFTEQCLNNLDSSWTGTVNSNNNDNNSHRITNMPDTNIMGTLKANYFLPIMNTSTTLNNNNDNNNPKHDEQQIAQSYFLANHQQGKQQQITYPSFPPPPPRILTSINSGILSTTSPSTTISTTITSPISSNELNFSRSSPVGATEAITTISTESGATNGDGGGGCYTMID
ncbi:unnamed protein product [Schistosoma bovis]|nr:unnamed protein product [Schistosoma bovis]